MENNNIDREFLISHLYDVRALELTKQKLYNEIQRNLKEINSFGITTILKKPNIVLRVFLTSVSSLVSLLLFTLVVGGFIFKDYIVDTVKWGGITDPEPFEGVYLFRTMGDNVLGGFGDYYYTVPVQPEFNRFIDLCIIISVALAIVITLIVLFSSLSSYNNYKQAKRSNEERLRKEQQRKHLLMKQNEVNSKKLSELDIVLSSNYSVNVIPGQFRTAVGVCYLYDYLSTSRESFQSALMNCNMNSINMNMQKMIETQGNMLIQQYITNARLVDLNKQNRVMMNRLANIEQNTELTAKYAAMNAANTRTIAFFKELEYLKQ